MFTRSPSYNGTFVTPPFFTLKIFFQNLLTPEIPLAYDCRPMSDNTPINAVNKRCLVMEFLCPTRHFNRSFCPHLLGHVSEPHPRHRRRLWTCPRSNASLSRCNNLLVFYHRSSAFDRMDKRYLFIAIPTANLSSLSFCLAIFTSDGEHKRWKSAW